MYRNWLINHIFFVFCNSIMEISEAFLRRILYYLKKICYISQLFQNMGSLFQNKEAITVGLIILVSLCLPFYTLTPEIRNLMLSRPVLNLCGIWCVATVVLALGQLLHYIQNSFSKKMRWLQAQ